MKHKTLRQLLALVLVVMMLVPNFAIPTFADGETEWTVSTPTTAYQAGDEVTLTVTVKNANYPQAINMNVNYDKNNLTLTNIEGCTALNAFTYKSFSVTEGDVNIATMSFSGAIDIPDDSEICKITFIVKENAIPDKYTVTLVAADGSWGTDSNGNDITTDPKVTPGIITVESGAPKIAQIVSDDADRNGTQYTNITNAIENAGSGDTIRLLEDVLLESDSTTVDYTNRVLVAKDKKVTLDLYGHSLHGWASDGGLIINHGDLTITDTKGGGEICAVHSGYNYSNDTYNGYDYGYQSKGMPTSAVYNHYGATLTIEKGLLKNGVTNKGTMTMNGGTIVGGVNGYSPDTTKGEGTAYFTMNGGTIYSLIPCPDTWYQEKGTYYYYYNIVIYGNFTMTGGTVYGSVMAYDGASVSISGGVIDSANLHYEDYYASYAAQYGAPDRTNTPTWISSTAPIFKNNSTDTVTTAVTGGLFRGVDNSDSYLTETTVLPESSVSDTYCIVGGVNEGWYQVSPKYSLSIEVDKTEYHPGDTVTATIYANAPAGTVLGNYQFTLNAPESSLLKFEKITSAFVEPNKVDETNGSSYACTLNTEDVVIPESGKLAVATATFTVKGATDLNGDIANCEKGLKLSLSNIMAGSVSGVFEPTVNNTEESTAFDVHNYHNVTINGNNGTVNGETSAVFALVGEELMLVDEGGALTEKKIDASMFAANSGYEFGKDKNGTTQFVKVPVYNESFAVTGYTAYTLKAFTTLVKNTCGSTSATLNTVATQYTFNATDTAQYSFSFETDSAVTADKGTFNVNSGEIKFKVNEKFGSVNVVSYKVGNGTKTHVITPVNGVYTINTATIYGDITITVEMNTVVTLTFKAGDGVHFVENNQSVNEVTRYAVYGNTSEIFSDESCTTEVGAPTPVADDGYRVPADTSEDPMWKIGDDYVTTSGLYNKALNADTEITVTGIRQYTVSFTTDGNGSIAAEFSTIKVDAGTNTSAVTMPQYSANEGYEFNEWVWSTEGAINADVTATAHFKLKTYSFSVPDGGENYTVNVSGATKNDDNAYTVTHNDQITITVTPGTDKALESVTVKNGETEVNTTSTGNGVYTYTFTVTGTPSVEVETYDTVTVTVQADPTEGGTVTPASIVVKKGTSKEDFFTKSNLTATPEAGYMFDKNWTWSVEGETIEQSMTLTAKFDCANYDVYVNNTKLDGATATYKTSYTLSKTTVTGIYLDVTATVNNASVNVTTDENGNYVVSGNDIIGDIYFTATELKVKIEFNEEYIANPAKEKVALLTATAPEGKKLALANGEEFYWSAKYNKYVIFVDADATVDSVKQQLALMTGTATEIDYNGDISANGKVTSVDAGIINDVLHGFLSDGVTDLMRFKMDVDGNGSVTTNDIMTILKKVVNKTDAGGAA